jgi:hypothetical protein
MSKASSSSTVGSSSSSRSSEDVDNQQRPAVPTFGHSSSVRESNDLEWNAGQESDEEIDKESRGSIVITASIAKDREYASCCCSKMADSPIQPRYKQAPEKSNWQNTCQIINASLITGLGITQFALTAASLPDLSYKIGNGVWCHGDGVTSPCPVVSDVRAVGILSPDPLAGTAATITFYSSIFMTVSGMALLVKACCERVSN